MSWSRRAALGVAWILGGTITPALTQTGAAQTGADRAATARTAMDQPQAAPPAIAQAGTARTGTQNAAPAATPSPARVVLFSPQGEARGVRQVTARFSEPMVALGDPRLEDPFNVACPAAGKGRWADPRNWVFDFEVDLPAGLRCTFTLKPDARTLAGASITGTKSFTFNTGGPSIRASWPYEGSQQLDEEQVFLLRLDAQATLQSIQQNAYCVIDGLAERVPVDVLTGTRREDVLAQRRQLGYGYYQLLATGIDLSDERARKEALRRAEEQVVTLKCQRRLPNGTRMQLVWGAGIAAASGISTRQAQMLSFQVRPAFTAQLTCTRTEPRAGCVPIQEITVTFSAPVPREQALATALRFSDKDVRKPVIRNDAQAKLVESVSFPAPFPEQATASLELPAGLRDDAGRPLANASHFPLEVRIDEYPPLVKFSGEFGILEASEGGVLPVTLRNIDESESARETTIEGRVLHVAREPAAVLDWLQKVKKAAERRGRYVETRNDETNDGERRSRLTWSEQTGDASVFSPDDRTDSLSIRKPAGARPAEVVGIPLKSPGLHVVELKSRRLGHSLLGRDADRYVATAALVTNLSVHLKWGRERSIVWVTRLDNGEPVANAAVTLTDVCSKAQLWQGTTDKDGLARIEQSLGSPRGGDYCGYGSPPLLVTATATGTLKGARDAEDFSFALSSWHEGIAPYDFGVPVSNDGQALMMHTVLDRPLFRAGETVSMKHFIRRHVLSGIDVPENTAGTYRVDLTHEGSGQRYSIDAAFDANGVAEHRWPIPADARLGVYSISLRAPGARSGGQSGSFRVEEFRLPTMRASIQGTSHTLVRPKEAVLDLHVSYLSGGGASNLPVKVRTVVERQPVRPARYEGFRFGGAPVKEGLQISEGGWSALDFESDEPPPQTANATVMPLELDEQGAARVTVPDLPAVDEPAVLTAELEYADANGELLTTVGRIRLVPSEVSVGIKPDGWVSSADLMKFRVVVLDLDNEPVAGKPVNVSLYQASRYSYRKRLIGGFYTYESAQENRRIEPTCEGVTNEQGLLLCSVAPGVSGEVLIRAEAQDERGNVTGATTSIWVAGEDDWWFGGTAADRMDVLPEKQEYEAGETARFQVRMPFRSARALVTVEREGVMRSFVTTLKGREPVLEVPLDDADAPNVFVSVLAVRGRVGTSLWRRFGENREITATVDLNKPAYRLGVAQVRVGWAPHRLDVGVTPDRDTYAIREQAKVRIEVKPAKGQALPADAEVAVVAVDEALLELAANPSWALLDRMMGQRGLEVWTSTAQLQVVGKRHYGRKAVPHGGGGGRSGARQSFDTLLAWHGRVKLDANGRAEVTVPLNDSLTTFRVVAVANAGSDLFGTGSASLATRQDLVLLSGLPPLVREGDRFAATFTVRNTSASPMTVELSAKVSSGTSLATQRAEIPPGQAKDIAWRIEAPIDAASLDWEVSARQLQGSALDRLKVSQRVIPALAVRTYHATLAQVDAPIEWPAALPKGAIPGRGGLEVTLRSKLGGGLDGVREYMSAYPYVCLEQRLSKAVALRDRALWNQTLASIPAYIDRDGLLRYFPNERWDGDDTLTSYVLAIANEAGWDIPVETRDRIVTGLTRFVEGRIVRGSALPTADLAVRKIAAISALSRYGVARPDMLDSITLEPNLWPTSAVIDWLGILRRMPSIPQRDRQRAEAEAVLRARLDFQGTVMTFSTERTDALWWLMVSADSNAVRALLELLDRPQWREDVPRLVRGALSRQKRGRWNTTVANAWGVLAMEKFSAAFESTPVEGATALRYGDREESLEWKTPASTGAAAAAGTSMESRFDWQRGEQPLIVEHTGTGKPWAIVRATAALPLEAPLFTGYRIKRTITPVEQQRPDRWTRGDVVRVRLELDAQSDMTWVVVDDPIPGGATVLGGGLGGQSQILARGERDAGFVQPAHEERRFEGFRAYFRFVPKGQWVVEYTARLNNPGTFQLPPTRVEAMYAPEMFGELPVPPMIVEPAP